MKRRFILAVCVGLAAVLIVASPVLAYLFRAPLTVLESSGTAYPMLAVGADLNALYMADNGFIQSDAQDTAIGTATSTSYPRMVTDSVTYTATTIPANGQVNLYLYTGEADTDMDLVVGDGGYVTVKDAAALEPGNTFEVEWSGYFPASDTGTVLWSKAGGAYAVVSASGEMTAAFVKTASTHSEILRPNATGDYTNIASTVGSATHWQNVDEAVADENTTYNYTSSASEQKDAYGLSAPTEPSTSTISSVDITYRVYSNTSPNGGMAKPYLRLGASETVGTQRSNTPAAYTDYTDSGVARPGGGNWVYSDLADLQVAIGIWNTSGGFEAVTQIYVTVNYYDEYAVTATGITAADHTYSLACDSVNLTLAIDGTTEDSIATAGVPVPNTANNWLLYPDPYWDYFKLTVGATEVLYFEPADIVHGAAYSTGTVTVTSGDATITGADGASFTDALVGSLFVSADGVWYTVLSVTDATHLELTTNYAGGTLAGQSYNTYPKMIDRDSGDQPGAITYGANPAGVTATLGGLVSGSQPAPGISGTDTTPGDQAPAAPASGGWEEETTVSSALQAMPIRPLIRILSDNSPLTELEVWRIVGGCAIVFVLVVTAVSVNGHHIITGIATGVMIGITCVVGIFTLWLLFLALLAVLVGAVFDRTASVT